MKEHENENKIRKHENSEKGQEMQIRRGNDKHKGHTGKDKKQETEIYKIKMLLNFSFKTHVKYCKNF